MTSTPEPGSQECTGRAICFSFQAAPPAHCLHRAGIDSHHLFHRRLEGIGRHTAILHGKRRQLFKVLRIIAAGGETSGAVTKALGYQAYRIGVSVAPGVPVLIPLENPRMRLILKSGNFGQEDFFARALEITAPGMRCHRLCR